MNLRLLLVAVISLWVSVANAHVGSPDVFYDGMVGPWAAHITIRMPGVVPGRAEIIAQVQSTEPVTVSFTPLSSRIAISNAPPPELAQLVRGETNLYTGDLWLMTVGAYSIEVQIKSSSAQGSVLIPVNSIATAQLPLPPLLGEALAGLGIILFLGGMVIVAAAAGESTLSPGAALEKKSRRKYWIAFCITGIVLSTALVGGRKWWNAEERDFRTRLREGGWPDIDAAVRIEGGQRILRLELGKTTFGPNDNLNLALDHGKLLHLFVVGLPDHQAIAHLHPVRRDNKIFEVALPPLPEGDYQLYCDLTLQSGLSSTATNTVHLPPIPARSTTNYMEPDPDDSWIADSAVAVRENPGSDTICRLPDGTQVIWKAHPLLLAKHDAAFHFGVRDQNGQPANLQPYMGMMSHAAVLRSDGRVFAHLHPTGNYSMAAQMLFNAKMRNETGGIPGMSTGMERSTSSIISLPYEFPTPGNFRVWVQIKTADHVQTAIFDTAVTHFKERPQMRHPD